MAAGKEDLEHQVAKVIRSDRMKLVGYGAGIGEVQGYTILVGKQRKEVIMWKTLSNKWLR
jgi:hypothetical protein